jgi:NADH:ubiquinone oxidoreductase subunit 2 (subunit N)
MSLLPFVVVTVVGGSLSLLARRERRLSAAIGALGLLAALVAASTIRDEPPLLLGGLPLAGTAEARVLLGVGTLTSGLLALVAAATRWSRELPGASLLVLGTIAMAAGTTDATLAVLAATLSAVAAAIPVVAAAGERSVAVAARELRALTVAAVAAIVAVALVGGPLRAASTAVGSDPAVISALLGLGLVGIAVAAAVRLGAIPFHLRVAPIADVAPTSALPLVLAWSPAAFAGVGLGWLDAAVRAPGLSLPVEQALVVVVAGATIGFATAAALLHDDLGHVVAYSIVADAVVLLLAFAALDGSAVAAAQGWLLGLVVVKSGLAGWAAVVRSKVGRNRVSELSGWARTAPVLAIGLVAVAVAGLGWPGAAVFEARRTLADAAVGGLGSALVLLVSMAGVVVPARLLAVGLAPSGGRAAPAADRRAGIARRTVAGRGRWLGVALGAWDRYRPMTADGSVVGLAAVALAVSSGVVGA